MGTTDSTDDARALSALFRLTAVAVAEYDISAARFLRVNEAFCELTGYSAAELAGMSYLDLNHPEDLTLDRERFERVLADGLNEHRSYKRYLRKDGQVRWVSVNVSLMRDDEGRAVRTIGVVLDMTARHLADQALRASELRERARAEEFKALLDTIPAAVWIASDPECRFVTGSVFAHDILRQPLGVNLSKTAPEEELPLGFDVYSKGQRVPPEQLPLQRAARGEGVAGEELELHLADGEVRHLSGNAVPLFDESGAPRGGVAAFIDITERVRSERSLRRKNRELERLNAELEEFAYAASHDLKAPLRAVSQLATWLDEDLGPKVDAENRQRLHLIRNRVVRMDELINGMLSYARLGMGRPPAPEPVDVGALLKQLLEEMQLPAGMTVQIHEGMPTLVTVRGYLAQVFQNLIGNAVKHHDRPAGRIELRAHETAKRWCFEVVDDGPGIPREQRELVFKMFSTLKRRDELEATGIGLALAKKLVNRYGGWMELLDNDPRGARFRFFWPKRWASEGERR